MSEHHEASSVLPAARVSPTRAFLYLGTLVLAYVGVYLCRKNLTVAVPLLQADWGLTKEQVGLLASLSTVAYAAGKVCFGPVTDRIGGRPALLGSMLLVAVFGLAGALAPGLLALTVLYSANRFAGAASWGAMVKLVPDWFAPRRLALACGLLSLSFVFGGALAVGFAGLIARLTGDSRAAILGVPALALLALTALTAVVIPRGAGATGRREARAAGVRRLPLRLLELFRERTFRVVLALSFTLTLLRETFNFWTVDFLRTEGGAGVSSALAAFLAMPFDLCGAAGIVLVGWAFDRLNRGARQIFLASILATLAALLWVLPEFFRAGLWALTAGVALIGFLAYGPYSLLAGVLAVEVRGKEHAATVAGFADATGYLAGVLSGVCFGKILTWGGYRLGFQVMAGLTAVAALLSLLLYRRPAREVPAPVSALSPGPQAEVS
jgi:OPA family glycerol-3-phosphate transporter-like MFS transporter